MGACFGTESYEEMYGPIRDEAAATSKAPASSSSGDSMLQVMTAAVFGSRFTDLACKVRPSFRRAAGRRRRVITS